MNYDQMIQDAMNYSGPLGRQYGFTPPASGPMTKLPEGASVVPKGKDYGAMIDAILKTVGAGMSDIMSNSYKGALPFASPTSAGGAPALDPTILAKLFPRSGGAPSGLAQYLRR